LRTSSRPGSKRREAWSTPRELRARTPGTHAQHAAGGLSSRDCVPGRRAPSPSEYDVSCTLGNPRCPRLAAPAGISRRAPCIWCPTVFGARLGRAVAFPLSNSPLAEREREPRATLVGRERRPGLSGRSEDNTTPTHLHSALCAAGVAWVTYRLNCLTGNYLTPPGRQWCPVHVPAVGSPRPSQRPWRLPRSRRQPQPRPRWTR
jgi:hypothetical protein